MRHTISYTLSGLCCGIVVCLLNSTAHADYPAYAVMGGKIGSERSLGETQLVVPLAQTRNRLLFTDLRIKTDTTQAWEGNAGLGYRQIVRGAFIVGAYGFFDDRQTASRNQIQQAAFGAELLTDTHDLRANLYLPEQDRHLAGTQTRLTQTGTQLFFDTQQAYEKGVPGADVEIGQKLPLRGMDVRVYGGGYHFKLDDSADMNGVRGRVRWQTGPLLFDDHSFNVRVSAEAQHDNIRGSQRYAGLELVIPFAVTPQHHAALRSLSSLEQRMLEPIVRDVDIVTHVAAARPVQQAAGTQIDGRWFDQVHVLNATDAASVTSGLNTLPDDAAILLNTPQPLLVSHTLAPKAGQALIASATPVTVSVPGTSQTIQLTNGGRATLVKANSLADGTPLIALANGSDTRLVNLDLVTESGASGDAIVMVSNNGQPIHSLTLDHVRSDGAILVDIASGQTNVNITGGQYAGGVFRTRSNAALDVMIDDALFHRTYATAVRFNQPITGLAFFEALDNATLVASVTNNRFINDRPNVTGRASLGIGFLNSSTVPITVSDLSDNVVTRTTGAWQAGAILGQATGGQFLDFRHVTNNIASPFESVRSRVNIGQAGYAASEAGLEAANPGMDFVDYGGSQFSNDF